MRAAVARGGDVGLEEMDEPVSVEEFQAQARAWISDNLERRSGPRARNAEYRTVEDIAVNRVLQKKLFDGGYAGISFPQEYGGRGLSFDHERAFSEEARGFVTPDLGGAGYVTFGPIARSMVAHASPAFCRRHIPAILSGEAIWCQFYSEPEAGSDLAGTRTSATRDGDRWVLHGSKIWSTRAYYADYAMCLARTNWDVSKHRGLTWFAVSTQAPGLTIREIRQINGAAGFCEEFLDGVEVTDDDMIGELNQGWTVAQTMLVYERGAGPSAVTAPEPEALAPDLVKLATRAARVTDPTVRQLIARAHINDYAQYHLGRRIAAQMKSSDKPDPAMAAYGKLATGTLTPVRSRIAMEIGGPSVLVWPEDDLAFMAPAIEYLNCRMTSIAGGTNEMQRNGIGERVLGLPREPSFDSNKAFSEVVRDARSWNGKVG